MRICVIRRWTSDKPLEQENKWKIYVDYWWKVNNRSYRNVYICIQVDDYDLLILVRLILEWTNYDKIFWEQQREREEEEEENIYIFTSYFCRCCQLDFFFFSFLKTYLQGLKKRTRCHAEVKQYCSKCIRVTESEGVSIIKVVALMSNEYFISWFDELKMRLDLSKTFFVDVYIYKICI